MKQLILLICTLNIYYRINAIHLKLYTKQGPIEGVTKKSRDGRPYLAFLGIPYAQPPVGHLRFRNPVAIEPWEDLFSATIVPNICIQPTELSVVKGDNFTIIGDEDCLYLNVFVPLSDTEEELMPVLFYIHDGLMRFGNSGQHDVAEYLMDESVILVTINYRLGIFGFLSAEDEIIPGNYALKDQAMALSWVKDNIESFGGDPKRITLLGYGTGASCAQLLTVSTLTQNSIKGVISSSGSYSSTWTISGPGYNSKITGQVARHFNCSIYDTKMMLNCLQQIDPKDLINLDNVFTVWDWDPNIIYRPTVEPVEAGAFLTEHPDLMDSSIPWITGITSGEENARKIPLQHGNRKKINNFIENINTIIPRIFYQDPFSRTGLFFKDKIKNKYFDNWNSIDDIIDGFSKAYAESNVIYPMIKSLGKHNGNVYVYNFDYRGSTSLLDSLLSGLAPEIMPLQMNKPSHADDLVYVIKTNSLEPSDYNMSKYLTGLWSNFARYQDPMPNVSDESELKWLPITKQANYMRIDGLQPKFEKKANLWDDIESFWEPLMNLEDQITDFF